MRILLFGPCNDDIWNQPVLKTSRKRSSCDYLSYAGVDQPFSSCFIPFLPHFLILFFLPLAGACTHHSATECNGILHAVETPFPGTVGACTRRMQSTRLASHGWATKSAALVYRCRSVTSGQPPVAFLVMSETERSPGAQAVSQHGCHAYVGVFLETCSTATRGRANGHEASRHGC